ncbi:Plancitoxin-1 [Trichinella nativa]|uniref:Plancitoxin-1 n=1 Tax=Trichinella nativa TaxID=6335 RepID=A0A0V1L2C3_9BILA|nr:Plancitoxin-1 [Trichinella nativa]
MLKIKTGQYDPEDNRRNYLTLKIMLINFRTVQYKVKDNVDSYIITNTAAADWSDIAINNANSPMVLTLDQYFKAAADKVNAAIIAYNNLPPGAVRPNAESTAKGLVAWGADTGKAFWYIHTMHKFPDFNIADASLLLDNLIEKAALFMCLTIDYKNTAWAKALLFEKPLIYFSQKPAAVGDAQAVFLEEDIMNLLNESPVTFPNNIYSRNVNTTGATPIVIHYIARYSSKTAQGDIYSRLIAPALQSSVRVWTGTTELNSYCSGMYKIENVEGPIQIKNHELTKQYDTSVWSVTTTGEKKFCLSNVERESASFKAGGVICIAQSNIQGLFSALASDNFNYYFTFGFLSCLPWFSEATDCGHSESSKDVGFDCHDKLKRYPAMPTSVANTDCTVQVLCYVIQIKIRQNLLTAFTCVPEGIVREYVFLFTFNKIMKTFFVLFLLGIHSVVEAQLGQWIQYKGPGGIDSYVITDVNNTDWHYVTIDNITSPLIETLDQYMTLTDPNKAEVALVAYNSFPPYFRRPVSQSLSKGLVAWGEQSGYAFWMVHTISKFPNLHEANSPAVYAFAEANEKAAMIMCLSIEYQDPMWAKVAYYEDAVVFYYRSPKTPGPTQSAFNVPDIQTLLGDTYPSLPSSYYSSSMQTAGVPSNPTNIFVAAKYGSFPQDMYMSLVLRTLKQSLRVWTGRGPHVYESLCNTNITIENVYGETTIGKSIFSAEVDTARWSISKVGVGKYFCLSNSGRERYLSNHPSGVVCIENEAVHNIFSKCATDDITQTCP